MEREAQEARNRTSHELTHEIGDTSLIACDRCGAAEAELWSLSCDEKLALAATAPAAEVIAEDNHVPAWKARLAALVELQGTAMSDADRREVDDAVAQVRRILGELGAPVDP